MAKNNKDNKNNTEQRQGMSREEAGRKGGKAPHVCRGRECNNESNKSTNKDKNNDSWFF